MEKYTIEKGFKVLVGKHVLKMGDEWGVPALYKNPKDITWQKVTKEYFNKTVKEVDPFKLHTFRRKLDEINLDDLLNGIMPVSTTKYLSKKYGGKWKYDKHGTWNCDDGKRWVSRVSGCSCDFDCGHPPAYYLYGDGSPKHITFY